MSAKVIVLPTDEVLACEDTVAMLEMMLAAAKRGEFLAVGAAVVKRNGVSTYLSTLKDALQTTTMIGATALLADRIKGELSEAEPAEDDGGAA